MTDSDGSENLLQASDGSIRVSVATHADVPHYRAAMVASRGRIGQWNPVNPDDLVHHLAAQSDRHRTFLIRDVSSDVRGPGGLIGCVNVSNVVAGRFLSATMGYNAFDGYAGTGLFARGLRLVVDIALRPAPRGMGLHRVEANVRIGNERSAGVLRALGFRRERTVRRMLWLADGADGPSAWRDHDSYAVTAEEWPADPYAPHGGPRGVVVLDETVAPADVVAVARELGVVALTDVPFEAALDVVTQSAAPVVWAAGGQASEALGALRSRGRQCADGSHLIRGVSGHPRAVTAAALAVRPFLG